jgi:hypothetical protein
MTDKLPILFSLILLGLSYPATLTACWLLFPERVENARGKIIENPNRSFWIGSLAALVAAIPAGLLFALQAQFTQLLGWIWVVVVLGFASLGSASIVSELGLRLNWKNDGAFLSLGAFLRGALIWELAAALPLIGWVLVIPVGTLISLGGFVQTLRQNKVPGEES